MAVILVLVCGVLGFGSAVAALFLFDISLFQAFGLWMVAGFVALIVSVLPVLVPHREIQEDRQAESA